MSYPITKSEINYQWSATLSKRLGDNVLVRTINLTKACGLSGNPVSSLISALYPVLPNKSKKPRTQALQSVLLNLLCASIESVKTGQLTGFLHQRTTASNALPSRYALNQFRDKTLTKVLDDLCSLGLVAYHKGFKGSDHVKGLATFWYQTDAFVELVRQWSSKDLTIIWFNQEIELVELKGLDDSLIDYADDTLTLNLRQAVSNTNELRLVHTWQYIPEIPHITHQNALQDRNTGQEYRTLAPSELICQRKFKGDFSTGGRFYAPFQQLTKQERATITIDGKPTVELDIKSAQPRMLYNLKGLESPVDCYKIEGIPRDTVKQLMLVALNAKDKEQAVRSLCIELKLERRQVLGYIDQLLEVHAPIADSFFSSAWRVVQYQDGELTNEILKAALAKGIAVLPVHDSYIVDLNQRDKMLTIIKSAYSKRFGFDCVVDG